MLKKIFTLFIIGLFIQACQMGVANGYVPTSEEIQEIKIGVDTKETVKERYGRPAFIGENENVWYYVSQYRTARGPSPNSEVERRVLEITFNGKGVVTQVRVLDQSSGSDIGISNAETPSGGDKLSLWDQITRGFGRISPDQFFD